MPQHSTMLTASPARGFLVLGLHVRSGLAHGLDDRVQRHVVLTVATQRHAGGVDRLTEAMALRSIQGICTSPPTGSQVRPRLCSMPISAAFSTCSTVPPSAAARPPAAMEQATPTSPWQPTSAPDSGRCAVQAPPGGQQEGAHALAVRAGNEAVVIVQHGRDDAGRAVGRRRDHAAAGGVFLVDGHGVQVDPVHHRQRIRQRALGALGQVAVQLGGAATHPQRPGSSPSASG